MTTTIKADLKPKLLNLTGTFEVSGVWGTLAGSFDGQGASWGVLQWNFGQGTLWPLLRHVVLADRSHVQAIMGNGFVEAVMAGEATTRSFFRHEVFGGLARAWRQRFIQLGAIPSVRKVMVAEAQPYFDMAVKLATNNGWITARGLALAFDTTVQMGLRDDYQHLYHVRLTSDIKEEWQKLKLFATCVADTADQQWRQDVLTRKMAIALGGTDALGHDVHGHLFSLAHDFGIAYTDSWA